MGGSRRAYATSSSRVVLRDRTSSSSLKGLARCLPVTSDSHIQGARPPLPSPRSARPLSGSVR
eukprot:scaffold116344_cov51-Phaeocystis_antarctica.AAC.3